LSFVYLDISKKKLSHPFVITGLLLWNISRRKASTWTLNCKLL